MYVSDIHIPPASVQRIYPSIQQAHTFLSCFIYIYIIRYIPDCHCNTTTTHNKYSFMIGLFLASTLELSDLWNKSTTKCTEWWLQFLSRKHLINTHWSHTYIHTLHILIVHCIIIIYRRPRILVGWAKDSKVIIYKGTSNPKQCWDATNTGVNTHDPKLNKQLSYNPT